MQLIDVEIAMPWPKTTVLTPLNGVNTKCQYHPEHGWMTKDYLLGGVTHWINPNPNQYPIGIFFSEMEISNVIH